MFRGACFFLGRWRRCIAFGLGAALLISLFCSHASANIPGGSSLFEASPSTQQTSQPWWDISKGRRCGRLYCSRILVPVEILHPGNRLTLAYEAPAGMKPETAISLIEQRAKTVAETVKDVRRHLTVSGLTADQSEAKQSPSQGKSLGFWWFRVSKPLNPLTPKVLVGLRNKAYVVYVEASPHFDIAQQTLVTVTSPDAIRAGMKVPALAEQWAATIRRSYSDTLWGVDFNRRFPGARVLLAVFMALLGLMLLWLVANVRRLLNNFNRRCKDLQASMCESARKEVMAAVTGSSEASTENVEDLSTQTPPQKNASNPGVGDGQSIASGGSSRVGRWLKSLLKGLRERGHTADGQGLISQVQNLTEMLLMFTNLLRICIILIIPILISGILPGSRMFSLVLLQQSIVIPLMWGVILIVRVVTVFSIDNSLNTWVKESSKRHPQSKRYALRAQSYSRVLKGGAALISILIGILLTLLLLGVDRSIFTSAGVIAVGVGLLSRNLLEDMLNGLLILANDRFAIGDVVSIANHGGLVEDMNIINTQLRGFDGQLTTLPNGLIKDVENLTKDWSRVNFEIVVSASEDLRRVLSVVGDVGEAMSVDPQWQKHFLEKPEVLGVDQIQHQGCLIRVWIKTEPLDQWMVGREFRVRIKEAFDREGICLGVPQRQIRFSGSMPTDSNYGNNI